MKPYYQDSAVVIYHGDCREILPQLPRADLVLTDPPYGIAYDTGYRVSGVTPWSGQIFCDENTSARDSALALLDGIPMLVFGSRKCNPPAGTRMVLVWDKGAALGMGALDLPWKPSSEEIYVIGSGFTGRRDESNVIYCPPVQSMAKNGRVHPNEKPIALLHKLLSKCPGGLVIDPFMGSGTTLRASKDSDRKAIGIETSEAYCEIAAKRMAQEVFQFSSTNAVKTL
jgi:DNA modification methylase